MTAHAITSLTLEHFRNYRTLSLTLDASPVVLRGCNGAGKTNVLEALSLLAPGRGLRGSRLREMDRVEVASRQSPVASKEAVFVQQAQYEEKTTSLATGDWLPATPSFPWVVAAKVMTRDEIHQIGTGRDGQSLADKRIIHINGERVRGHAQLAAHACVQWLTPNQDQLFIEGGSARRKFFDRLVYGFAPEHAARVTAYENAMRERNKLLTEERGRADPYWLSVLEQQMAEHAVAITSARQEMFSRLGRELSNDIAHFPRAELYLSGTVENLLNEDRSALEAESIFAERLKNERPIDAARGRTGLGPHKSEWTVIHSEKQREAASCSTGEQKALLLSITLAAARARASWCGVPPILLLDEVIAHLDESRRAQLFALIRECRIQAWMTGTDAGDFRGIEPHATVLEVAGGLVRI